MPELCVHLPHRTAEKCETRVGDLLVRLVPWQEPGVPRALHPYKRNTSPGLGSSIGAHEIRSTLQQTLWPTCASIRYSNDVPLGDALRSLEEEIQKRLGLALQRSSKWRRRMRADLGAPPLPGMCMLDICGNPRDYGQNAPQEFTRDVPGQLAWPGCVRDDARTTSWSAAIDFADADYTSEQEAVGGAERMEYAMTALHNIALLWAQCHPVNRKMFDELHTAVYAVDNLCALIQSTWEAFMKTGAGEKAKASRYPKKHQLQRNSFDGSDAEFVRFLALDFPRIPRLGTASSMFDSEIRRIAKMKHVVRNAAAHRPWALNKPWGDFGAVPCMPGTDEVVKCVESSFCIACWTCREETWFPLTGLDLAHGKR